MKPYDILDAIGNVDEICVVKAKEKRKKKTYKRLWIAAGSFAACLALFISIPFIFMSMSKMGKDAPPNTNDEQGGAGKVEETLDIDNVWIYYVHDNEIIGEQQELKMSAECVFNAWKEKNGIGEDVEFISVNIESNGKTSENNGMVEHQVGDYFVYNITISKSIENYYDIINKELLLESLKQTMTGYLYMECDEYHLILE